jgi:hypothetical protein
MRGIVSNPSKKATKSKNETTPKTKKGKKGKTVPFPMNLLPPEVKLEIFGSLPPKDLLALAQTCKDVFRC